MLKKLSMQMLKERLLAGERIDTECKEAEKSVPKSVYESYSAFANTDGGIIVLGIKEVKKKSSLDFEIQGVENVDRQITDFWNTINSQKVSANILADENVYKISEGGKSVIVIHVPRADYKVKPVYVGENPLKGSFRRNHEGDYHATADEVRGMMRDQNPDGNDSLILEGYTMDDIDHETLREYRQRFVVRNPEHVWNGLDSKNFLQMLGGYRYDKKRKQEGLTMAGLLMFGKGLPVRDEFPNLFMDYRDESRKTADVRWVDRITYDGTWENNLFNFFIKVAPKLTADLKKPFVLNGMERIDDSPVHKAVREGFVNAIIHADYQLDAGTLKIIKQENGFTFTNPGSLKLSKEEIFKGGISKPRNPKMQTMLRMVGFGDNAGSGIPTILDTWENNGWKLPELVEEFSLNQVTLSLELIQAKKSAEEKCRRKVPKKSTEDGRLQKTEENIKTIEKLLAENGEMTTAELSAKMNNLSATRIRRLLKLMGNVVSDGNTTSRKYKLNVHK